MATEKTILTPPVNLAPDSPAGLFDDADGGEDAATTGEWFPIRIMPDLATGELLNVGVVFVDQTGQRHFRLIENARPFRCLYGATGQENYSFLLQVLREHLQRADALISPSPHIILGKRAYAAGESCDEVVNRLFGAMVALRCDEATHDVYEKASVNTETARRNVFKAMKAKAPAQFERLVRNAPVRLEDNRGNPLILDLPLWNDQPDMYSGHGPRFGTIVSAHYRDKVYRGSSLNGGSLGLLTAAMILGEQGGRGSLLILRPADGTEGYDRKMLNLIENDIDTATFALQGRKDLRICVDTDYGRLAEAALELANK